MNHVLQKSTKVQFKSIKKRIKRLKLRNQSKYKCLEASSLRFRRFRE